MLKTYHLAVGFGRWLVLTVFPPTRGNREVGDVIDDVKAAMSGLLKPNLREERLGEVEIREIFKIPKAGKIWDLFLRLK